MSSVCVSCGRPADQFRDIVRVVNMRVEITCRSCAAAGAQGASPPVQVPVPVPVAGVPSPPNPPQPSGPFAAPSPQQSQPYPYPSPPAPHPHGHGTGAHAALPPTGMPAPVLTPPAPPPQAAPPPTPARPTTAAAPRPRPPGPAHPPASRRNEVIGLAVVLVVALGSLIALVAHSRGDSPGSPPTASGKKKPGKKPGGKNQPPAVSPEEGATFDEDAPPPEGLAAIMTGAWTHPLAGPFRELPGNDVQRFGAYRARDEFFKRYCGSGHCGIDLGNDTLIGLPVIACRDGVIEKIAHQPTVLEGKYLRIKHAGDVRTYYMHLDQVAPELVLGGTVKAGQMIGTLGHTGIKNSAAHLHFMITFESKGKEMYIDPEPILQQAALVEIDTIPDWAKPSGK